MSLYKPMWAQSYIVRNTMCVFPEQLKSIAWKQVRAKQGPCLGLRHTQSRQPANTNIITALHADNLTFNTPMRRL